MEGTPRPVAPPATSSFFYRHQFVIWRLFSITGLLPIGGYLCVHLLTNATILNGAAMFQEQVDRIHSLGVVLPLVEWTFIFLPLLFHAFVGWLIISGAVPNTSVYPYANNIRYTLQRATGMIAFFYLIFHVWQLNHMGHYFGGGEFVPERASSSAAQAIDRALWIQIFYAIGVLACVYHLANGVWTFGIRWGLWTSRAAQRRANYVSLAIGLLLAAVGLSALGGMATLDIKKARQIEDRFEYAKKIRDGEVAVEPTLEPPAGATR